MSLYLVQHGKALSKDEDPEQGLSAAGRSDVERIASVAAVYQVNVARMEHSPKSRARETAELLARHIVPTDGVAERSGIKALDDVAPVAAAAAPTQNLMLVGHLPFLERLTGLLVTGDADQQVFRFQNGGIVCLDVEHTQDGAENGDWFVKWALMPEVG